MKSDSIVICGADGMLGSWLTRLAKERYEQVSTLTIKDLDITQDEAIDILIPLRPKVMINAAAYTAVDRAETDESTAIAVNAEGVRRLAETARVTGAKLVHISTDYVFQGDLNRPYLETDPTGPRSAYGRSKLMGERFLQEILPESQFLLLRTAWLYGEDGKNFVSTIIHMANERPELGVIADQMGNPTYAKDLAQWLLDLVDREAGGVFHAVNSGFCSWYDLAVETLRLAKIETPVKPISSAEYPLPAPRPKNSRMTNDKLKKALEYSPRKWSEALKEYIVSLKL